MTITVRDASSQCGGAENEVCAGIDLYGVNQNNPVDFSTGTALTGSVTGGSITTKLTLNSASDFIAEAFFDGSTSISTATTGQTVFMAYNNPAESFYDYAAYNNTVVSAGTFSESWATPTFTDIAITAIAVSPAGPPVVLTSPVNSISFTGATGNGTIVTDGGYTVTGSSICYGTMASPAQNGGICVNAGITSGSFSVGITGLSPGSIYHTQAQAVNSQGTGYGADVPFYLLQKSSSPNPGPGLKAGNAKWF